MEAAEFFLAQREYGAAVRAWEQLETLSEPLELTRALRIVDTFVEAGRIDEASRAWRHALRASRSPEGYTAGSLVWDGGFEQEFLNAGFGWKNPGAAGVRVDFDSSAPHSGARSLRLRFEGSSNLDLTVPYQIVAVQPATRYRFSAYVKLDGVTTDSGLRFHLFDPRASGAIIAETPNLTGTMPWTQQEVEFVTGPATRLLRISLRRTPSAKFDNKIRGTAGVDDVMLVPAAAGAPR